MVEHKLVLSTKDGKSYQKEIKSPEADYFHGKIIGDKILGDEIGYSGYEFKLTGGSDKCGFPMRKGIQQHRKKIRIGAGVGFSGKNRNKKKQNGLLKRRTVCGERITRIIRQINLKVVKEGAKSLGEAPAEEAVQEAPTKEV
jgi:small subunit ribosomal protein S6e